MQSTFGAKRKSLISRISFQVRVVRGGDAGAGRRKARKQDTKIHEADEILPLICSG